MKNRYELLENDTSNTYSIKFTEGAFEGIIFTLGKVKLFETEEGARLTFHYDVVSGIITDEYAFKTAVGDLLLELIEAGIHNNDLIYTGGVDENREVDYRELDSE